MFKFEGHVKRGEGTLVSNKLNLYYLRTWELLWIEQKYLGANEEGFSYQESPVNTDKTLSEGRKRDRRD